VTSKPAVNGSVIFKFSSMKLKKHKLQSMKTLHFEIMIYILKLISLQSNGNTQLPR
jgi:hypothetical protein